MAGAWCPCLCPLAASGLVEDRQGQGIRQGQEYMRTRRLCNPGVARHSSRDTFPSSPARSSLPSFPSPCLHLGLHSPFSTLIPSEPVSLLCNSPEASVRLTQVGVQGPYLPWSCSPAASMTPPPASLTPWLQLPGPSNIPAPALAAPLPSPP